MTLLCAALAAIAALLAVPPAPGRSLDRRLARVDVQRGRGRRTSRWWLPLVSGVAGGLVAGWVVAGAAGVVVAAASMIAVLTMLRLIRLRNRGRRAAAARADVAHACRVLAGQLRVGRIPADAVRVAAVDCPVLGTASSLLELGSDPVRHWRDESARPGYAGLLVLARAWSVATRTGAPLAPSLERVAEALGRDLAVERLVFGEAAAARATAKVMAAMPICGIGLGYLIGGRPLQFLVSGPLGWACLVGGLAAAAAGVLWIDWLSRTAEESSA
jgi:tight adherence protein B